MIQNLNPITFRDFGAVLPERKTVRTGSESGNTLQLRMQDEEAVVYRAAAQTHLCLGSGMSVLSVSVDGASFQNFYLDKPVSVRPGILFALTPFMAEATVSVFFEEEPVQVSVRPRASLRVDHQLRVEGMYAFYYQVREQGFLFPGEAHPFPELTYVDQGEFAQRGGRAGILLKQGMWRVSARTSGICTMPISRGPGYVTITFDLERGYYPAAEPNCGAPAGCC